MLKKSLIHAFLFLDLGGLLFASNIDPAIKSNSLGLEYTFSKVFLKSTFDKLITYTSREATDLFDRYEIDCNFTWGNQGSLIWEHCYQNSAYTFIGKLSGLHTSYNFYIPIAANEEVSDFNDVFFGGPGAWYKRRDQINFFDLDLSVKTRLLETKHAIFSVYGGAIIAGYRASEHINAQAYDYFRLYFSSPQGLSQRTEYFAGPDLKIEILSNFFRKHLQLGAKLGLGFMMGYVTSSSTFNGFKKNALDLVNNNLDQGTNVLRYGVQGEVELSVALNYRHFTLAGGLNQFFYQPYKPLDYLSFGGPFIRAPYEF